MRDEDIGQFRQTLRGRLITRSDPDYDEARALYNGMIDKRPLLIARCADVADVIAAVNFGRDNGLLIAIRGGGHNGPGLGSVDDGLVIDLSTMKGVRVDPATRTVRVGPGCTSGRRRPRHPCLRPGGPVRHRLDHRRRRPDARRRARLPDAQVRPDHRQSARGRCGARRRQLRHRQQEGEPRPLLGAARRRRQFRRGHQLPVPGAPGEAWSIAGPIFWDAKHGTRDHARYRDFLPNAPEELGAFVGLKTVPSIDPFPQEIWGKRICALIVLLQRLGGGRQEGAGAAARQAARAVLQLDEHHALPGVQGMFDALFPKGMQWYWKGDFVKTLPDAAIDAHLEQAAKAPSELSLMHLYPIDGAVHRVGKDETAWNCRDATWSMVIAGDRLRTRSRPGR